MCLGKLTVGWLSKTVEELLRGDQNWDFYRTFKVGNTLHLAQGRVNSYERYLEILKYGAGGRWSFVIIPKGRKNSGWVTCSVQMRKLANYLEEGVAGSKYSKKHEDSLLMPRPKEKGRQSFMEFFFSIQ